MQGLQRGIIDLVRASLTQEKAELGPDFDWNAAYEIGCRHDMIPMLYYGVAASGIQPPDEVRQKLRLTAIKCTVLDRNQRAEIDQIEQSFEAQGIDYLPLKGVAMKPRYPRSEMRTMGDADTLIREEQYADIRPIMDELGFTEILESDHELVWDKPGLLHLELHKRLIPSYNKDYYAYYGDGWKLARKTGSTMEYIDKTIETYIQHNNDRLSLERRKGIIRQICRALEYIHYKGLLHRDLSITNALVQEYEDTVVVKLSDFGLVKIENSTLTSTASEIKGSLNDPDLQRYGFANYNICHETYALTKLCFYILTGKSNIEHQASGMIKDFYLKGTDPVLENRYQSVEDLLQTVESIQ